MSNSIFSKAALIALVSFGIAGAVQAKDLQPRISVLYVLA